MTPSFKPEVRKKSIYINPEPIFSNSRKDSVSSTEINPSNVINAELLVAKARNALSDFLKSATKENTSEKKSK